MRARSLSGKRPTDSVVTVACEGSAAAPPGHSSLFLDGLEDFCADTDAFEPPRDHRGTGGTPGGLPSVAADIGDHAQEIAQGGHVAEPKFRAFAAERDRSVDLGL